MSESKDWRIGLTVIAKYRNDPLYYESGEIIDVFPSGTGGLEDKDGILKIKMRSGSVILRRSDEWKTG